MIRHARARLTYANVAASLALFLALSGGVAYALGRNSVTTRELAKDSVKGRNVDNGKLKNKHLQDNTLRGNKIRANTLGPVPHADSPTAFARVRADTTVVQGLSRRVTSANVTTTGPGVYCFDLPFDPNHVQATAVASGPSDRIASAEDTTASPTLPNCPPGNEAEVNIYSVSGGGLANASFFVEFGF